jgi:mono/diheme cytochrome c family protein
MPAPRLDRRWPLALAIVLAAGPARADEARELMARFECHRCHEDTGLAAAPRERSCVGCHRDIIAGRFVAAASVLRGWQRNLTSLRQAPALGGGVRRLRRDWVRGFLLAPSDCRPALPATMPRLPLAPAQADLLARALVPDDAGAAVPPAGDVAAGRALYEKHACGTCHRFTGAAVRQAPVAARAPDAIALAPDLALARVRVQPDRLAEWLLDPQRLAPESLMPKSALLPAEAAALAAFLLSAPLAGAPAARPVRRLPPLGRRVGFAEVERAVLRKVCWHCHSQADYALGDGGVGNTGGFGYPPRGLDLSSYGGAASGALGDDGERHSIFTPQPDGTPLLVARLLARQAEEAGRPVPGVIGMPLGFPSLSPKQIQLVESWIAQGRPR